MKSILITTIALLLAPLASLRAADIKKPGMATKPNIIFILTDDVGLGELSCSGAVRFKTPNIDALAKTGVQFGQCYSMALCGPSRATLLTGRYPFRTGIIDNHSKNVMRIDKEIMISTVMKKAGYVTASAGKWGQMPAGPSQWGFDESLAAGNGQYWKGKYTINGNSQSVAEGKYIPDLTHDFVVDFINRHKDQPFFVYYSMIHIHIPILPTPDSKPGASRDQLYTDNIVYMDKLVAKLVAELDRLKLREKTLIVFAGDNGTAKSSSYSPVNGRPLSGHKGSTSEGGTRVPMIVNWPGTTPTGKVNQDLVDFTDFLPTFAELGGASLPQGVTIDGHSFAPQIKGEKGNPREWVYAELMGQSFVRDARWKLQNDGELLNMKDAPFNEIPVPSNTTDAEAVAARKRLQVILDQHTAAPYAKDGGGKQKQQKASTGGK